MKWSKEQEQQIRELSYEEKSNNEIAQIMGIELKYVHAGRSRFGITIPKIQATKAKGGQEITLKRTEKEIREEMDKVTKARREANNKVIRCDERFEALYEELKEAANGGVMNLENHE